MNFGIREVLAQRNENKRKAEKVAYLVPNTESVARERARQRIDEEIRYWQNEARKIDDLITAKRIERELV
jgi:hypothetical protein